MQRYLESLARGHAPEGLDRLMTSPEVARILSISERSLWQLTRDGVLPCVRIGRSVRYTARSLEEWIRSREASGGQQRQLPKEQERFHGI